MWEEQPFRIAIIGGGLGGLYAALAIHYHCHSAHIQIDVYEQAAEYKEIGAGVGIGPNAAKLIENIGLGDEACKIAGKRNDIWITFRRYDTGGEVVTVTMPPDAGKLLQLPMHRAEFLDLLTQAIRQRGAATLHTKKQCRKLEEQGDSMVVTFADGSTTSANLVIGADGIHSAVRANYVDDQPQYGGMVVYRGLCPIDSIQDHWPLPSHAAMWIAPGKHLLTFPISNNKTLNVVGFVSTPYETLGEVQESWTLQGSKADVQREYADFEPVVQNLLDHMDHNPLKWILFDRPSLKQWIYAGGKVALLGDAAHAMCPHQGAGAGQAIEDGYILARCLQDYFASTPVAATAASAQHGRPSSTLVVDVEPYLDLYQAIRLPRAERVQATSRQAGDLYEFKDADVRDLDFQAALPVVKDKIAGRMKWIWTDDIDAAYEAAKASSVGLGGGDDMMMESGQRSRL